MEKLQLQRSFFEQLWNELNVEGAFNTQAIASQAAKDGGYDFESTGLSINDLENTLNRTGCKTGGTTFFVSEILAYYYALHEDISPMQIMAFALTASMARYLARQGHIDWDMQITSVVDVLCATQKKLSREAMAVLLDCIFEASRADVIEND